MEMFLREDRPRAPVSEQAYVPDQPDDVTIPAVTAVIDGLEVTVSSGTTILDACKKIGIKVPTLCHHPDVCIAGVCRVCLVEVEGQRALQASCAYPITEPITVRTHTGQVRRARRHVVDLLLRKHHGECYSCWRNNNCELQSLARDCGVDFFRFGHPEQPLHQQDRSSYSVYRDMNKCVLCRRCVRTCVDLQEVGVYAVAGRSNESRVATYQDKPLRDVVCINCGQCINRCPTGALRARVSMGDVWQAIDDPHKHVVVQTAPSPRAGIGECFDLDPGHSLAAEMNTALRRMGFDRVFDTNFTADLTIIEEGTELIQRLEENLVRGDHSRPLPQFTSCSPGWVKFIEHFYPEYLPNMSSAKSPQQMFGAIIKTWYAEMNGLDPADIVTVALMPCSAKKYECNRPEMVSSGHKDVDYGLTTRELGAMIREAGIWLPDMPGSDFDDPFGSATGSGQIFGATGGVMESALRTVVDLVTGLEVEDIFADANILPVRGFEGVKYAEITVPQVGSVPALLAGLFDSFDFLEGATLKVAVAHGTANAKRVMENIKEGGKFSECHFIEFMACPGGCLGGGGQPIPTNAEIRDQRAKAIYDDDMALEIRKSYENPAIARIYERFLTDGPCGDQSHRLLHTHYTPRGKFIA
jgi:iron-only hydrogenase group A